MTTGGRSLAVRRPFTARPRRRRRARRKIAQAEARLLRIVAMAESAGVSGSSDERPVLVCGLGALGQRCVEVLGSYGVPVRALDVEDRAPAASPAPFVRGDCRSSATLRGAGLESCRGALFVTGDPRANIEGALAARKISPSLRIVSRAAEHHLNELLGDLLGNFVAYEPNRLAGGALALAALGSEVVGHFHLEGRLVRVVRHRVTSGDPWTGAAVERANAHGVVVLEHHPADTPEASSEARPVDLFHRFDPNRIVRAGDLLTLLVIDRSFDDVGRVAPGPREALFRTIVARFIRARRSIGRTTGVVLGAAAVAWSAVLVAAFLFPLSDPTLSRLDGAFSALVLMTGGTYADLFPAFHFLPNALRVFSILLSVIGTVAAGLLYAWLTDRLMTIRLRIAPRRPDPPSAAHVVVVGLGRVGRAAAALLRDLGRGVAVVEMAPVDGHTLPHLPIIEGSGTDRETLEIAGTAGARGLLAVTENDWANLEVALLARKINGTCQLVIRTRDPRFSENVAGLLPGLRVLCVPVIAAKAFVAAALGEDVLDLFQLGERTVFVIEFRVEAGDGLVGRLLSDVAEGYSVVPVLLEPGGHDARFCSPVDQGVRLAIGDRLVLLAPSRSLQRIERGDMLARSREMRLTGLRAYGERLAVAAVLVKHRGYALQEAQEIIAAIPAALPERLYPHQAERLRIALEAAGADLESSPVSS